MGAPSNGSKTAHSKVANGNNGNNGNGNGNAHTSNQTSKRSSSGADGDYQLVQHEVLYSLNSQYEVSTVFTPMSPIPFFNKQKNILK
jgi:homeodomain interacting protein kinase